MKLNRLAPIAILLIVAAGVYSLGLHRHLSLDALRDNRGALLELVNSNYAIAALGFAGLYAAVVALSLPAGTVLTVAGGLLFGIPAGVVLAVLGATAGAAIVFLVARSAAGDALRTKAGPFVSSMAEGFRKDAFNYLLFLRLIPAFPFWVVNLAPALLGMRFVPYVVGTALGIVPGTTVFSLFGASLGEVFDRGGEVSLKSVVSPTMIAAFVGLGLLSLLPIAIRRLRGDAS